MCTNGKAGQQQQQCLTPVMAMRTTANLVTASRICVGGAEGGEGGEKGREKGREERLVLGGLGVNPLKP